MILVLGMTLAGRDEKSTQPDALRAANSLALAATPVASAPAVDGMDAPSTPQVAGMDASSTPQVARVRVIVKGRIDENRFAALQVEVVQRRGNGQLVLLVPADRLDALRSLPGDFTTRVSTPVNAL
jgi:hypothetical protein